jgi:mannose-6-phosphate isomerase-like protein (cupin superfamily)
MESHLDKIGNWPSNCPQLRREKKMLHLPPESMLHFVHGKENQTQVSFFLSNDQEHIGIHTITPNRMSDPETHGGDEVLLVLEGRLQVRVASPDDIPESVSHVAYEVNQGEKFFIPEGVEHQYFNLSDRMLRFLFAVAPDY